MFSRCMCWFSQHEIALRQQCVMNQRSSGLPLSKTTINRCGTGSDDRSDCHCSQLRLFQANQEFWRPLKYSEKNKTGENMPYTRMCVSSNMRYRGTQDFCSRSYPSQSMSNWNPPVVLTHVQYASHIRVDRSVIQHFGGRGSGGWWCQLRV